MRKTNEELNALKKTLGISTIWSWSRYKAYIDDSFSYYLKYVAHVAPDRNDSIYAPIGGACHDIIESYYNGKISQSEMYKLFCDKLYELKLFGSKFNRSDNDKDRSISRKYEQNLEHFFKNHVKPAYDTELEKFVLIEVAPKLFFQGYIDCLHRTVDRHNKVHYWITDFKTSSMYQKRKMEDMSGQLLLYAMYIANHNVPVNQIHIQFHFLKYLTCKFEGVNGKITERHLERHKFSRDLWSRIKIWLDKLYPDLDEFQIFYYLNYFSQKNDLDILPDDVKSKFSFSDCYVEIPFGQTDLDDLKNNMVKIINEIKEKTRKISIGADPKTLFWKDVDKSHSFFMANLSEYSLNLHEPYRKYLEKREPLALCMSEVS